MNRTQREARKELVYKLLGTSAYTQADVAEKLKLSKSAVSAYTKELIRDGRLVEIGAFPNDPAPTKRYSSIRMADLEPGSSINMDANFLMETFLDYVRRHFPAGGYDNERELTMRVERAVRAVVMFPFRPDETQRLINAEHVRSFISEVISDVTDLLMLLKAFAAIDLRSRAVHPILTDSEALESLKVIESRVESGIAHGSQEAE